MASPTQWTWVWVNSGSWWWTGWPGVLCFMGSQRIGHDWATELNWTYLTNAKRCPMVLPLGQVSQSTYGFLKTNSDLLRTVEAKKGGPDEGKLAFCTGSIKAHRGETLGRPEGHKECWREKTDCQSGDFLVITALTVRRGQISTELFSEGSACRQCFIVYPVPGSNLAWVHAFVFRLSPSWTLSSSLTGLLWFPGQARLVLASEALNWPCCSFSRTQLKYDQRGLLWLLISRTFYAFSLSSSSPLFFNFLYTVQYILHMHVFICSLFLPIRSSTRADFHFIKCYNPSPWNSGWYRVGTHYLLYG